MFSALMQAPYLLLNTLWILLVYKVEQILLAYNFIKKKEH